VEDSLGEFVAEVKEEIPMADLMMGSDICITDYSSVIFEYALLEKPMLFYAYDVSEYYDERGFYYPYETFVPGKIVKTTEELVQGILHLDQKDIDKVKEFREQYMSGCDGHATSRILSEINKYKEDMKNGK
jgi:CDP-ribitol ribitolphosphotransferase